MKAERWSEKRGTCARGSDIVWVRVEGHRGNILSRREVSDKPFKQVSSVEGVSYSLFRFSERRTNSHSYIGGFTNGHNWIVCHRVTDASGKSTAGKVPSAPIRPAAAKGTIAVTKLTGVRPNGKSNALNIFLAITLWADQHTAADATP